MEGMEKRVLIAIVLSVLVLIGYQYLAPTPPSPPKTQQTVQPVQNPAESTPVSQSEALPLSGKMAGEEKTSLLRRISIKPFSQTGAE